VHGVTLVKAAARAKLDTTTTELDATKESLTKSKMTRAALLSYLMEEIGSAEVSSKLDAMNIGGSLA
jgi:hypothetical protein